MIKCLFGHIFGNWWQDQPLVPVNDRVEYWYRVCGRCGKVEERVVPS